MSMMRLPKHGVGELVAARLELKQMSLFLWCAQQVTAAVRQSTAQGGG